jgi:hypothetical protein
MLWTIARNLRMPGRMHVLAKWDHTDTNWVKCSIVTLIVCFLDQFLNAVVHGVANVSARAAKQPGRLSKRDVSEEVQKVRTPCHGQSGSSGWWPIIPCVLSEADDLGGASHSALQVYVPRKFGSCELNQPQRRKHPLTLFSQGTPVHIQKNAMPRAFTSANMSAAAGRKTQQEGKSR